MRTSGFTPRSVYIYKVAKSLGFCFGQKRKNKTKRFCLALSWKSAGFQDRTTLSSIVSFHYPDSETSKVPIPKKNRNFLRGLISNANKWINGINCMCWSCIIMWKWNMWKWIFHGNRLLGNVIYGIFVLLIALSFYFRKCFKVKFRPPHQ